MWFKKIVRRDRMHVMFGLRFRVLGGVDR
jgi:hypothetical protein